MLRKYFFELSIVIILVLATLLRFPFLSTYPPAMIQDEVGIGYAAISIAETGMDEWGQSYPLIFKSFGDYKAPAFIYATAALYKIIGFHPVLPRLTSALAGILFTFSMIMLTHTLSRSKKLAILAGLVVATNPWTIHLSRMALESNLGLAFFTTGLWLFVSDKKSKLRFLLAAVFLSLSTYSFHSYRYSVALFFIALIGAQIVFNFTKIKKQIPIIKRLLAILILTTILSLPAFLAKGATGRLDQTLLFTSDKVIRLYEHYENNCHGTAIEISPSTTILCRLQYNKFSRMALIGTDSLIKHLDPTFYFFTGDTEPVRNPTSSGELYIFLFPLWMLGILELFKKYKQYSVVIVGYLIALIPSVVSGDPHATRLSILIPFLLLTIFLGYTEFEKLVSKRGALIYIVLLTLIFTPIHMLNYATDTFAGNEIEATFLSYAQKAAKIAYEYEQKGYTVFADHDLYPEPHVYYAFYNQIPPQETQASLSKVYQESAGFTRPKQFGQLMYFEQGDLNAVNCEDPEQKTVFITNDKHPSLKPTDSIKDNTGLYEFIYIYTTDDICKQSTI